MKIALAQMRVRQGMPEYNYQNLALFAERAKALGAELIAFPEMCLSGYLIGDERTQDGFSGFADELLCYNGKIAELSKKLRIIIVYGNIAGGEDGNESGSREKYSAVYLSQNGNLYVRKKYVLSNCAMFGAKRYFCEKNEEDCRPIILEGAIKAGLEICGDLRGEDYQFSSAQKLISQGADFIINVSASPFFRGESKIGDDRIKELKKLAGPGFVPFYYVNCVGTQNNGKTIITFDGGSRIYDKNGEISDSGLNPYEENLLFPDISTCHSARSVSEVAESMEDKQQSFIDPAISRRVTAKKRFLESPIEQKFLAIREAYESMDEILGNPKYVFGLSGGIDSVLNLVLCSLTLGKDKILAYNLPAVYNSQATKQAAAKVCSNLGISLNTIAIDNILKEYELSLCRGCHGDVATDINVSCYVPMTASVPLTLNSVTRENLQSRIRMAILMAQTSQKNAVLINNTNKVELALGYGTLYGDLAGAWCPLGDLLKTEIWEMARFVNEKFGQIIPPELIPDENLRFSENQIYPSAELKENQIDPMIWGFDDWLLEQFIEHKRQTPEKILRLYLYQDAVLKELCVKYNLENANDFISHCEWFFTKLYANAFKRIQSPPVLVLSKFAFPGDCRESQYKYEWTQNYKELKRQIMENRERQIIGNR